MPTEEQFKAGDRVTRKPINNFDRSGMKGTIVGIEKDHMVKGEISPRSYIKWDIKQNTGQQHSTIQNKFLIKI